MVTEYLPRVVDAELDELFRDLAAVALEGPRAVGKTATAERRVNTSRIDEPAQRALVSADLRLAVAARRRY
jgi:hypothetical protein